MQDCFRKYPEIYGSELADDEDEEGAPAQEGAGAEALAQTKETPAPAPGAAEPASTKATEKKDGEGIPKQAFDTTDVNKGKK
jgi:intermembrane space import and assembly protein 40